MNLLTILNIHGATHINPCRAYFRMVDRLIDNFGFFDGVDEHVG